MADGQNPPAEISVDTQHDDMVHDAQLDYYGRKLATCSSDRTIKIFQNNDDRLTLLATLTGHEGPIWQVAWSHPRFGEMIASASYDGQVIIYRGIDGQKWDQAFSFASPERQSFNSVSFGPQEYGLILAAASSDGKVYIIKHDASGAYVTDSAIDVSNLGTNAVSWAPANPGSDEMRLVTGSCDNHVDRVDEVDPPGGMPFAMMQHEWVGKQLKDGHSDWVRDVAWAPSTGLSYNMIASAGEDGRVIVWTEDPMSHEWKKTEIPHVEGDGKAPAPAWRVSWSVTGNVLAVSSGDQRVTLYKQDLSGKWTEWHWQKGGEAHGRWEGQDGIAGGGGGVRA